MIPMAQREIAEWGLAQFPVHHSEVGICSCEHRVECTSKGKHPWLKNWQAIATTDQQQIARWIIRYPNCNWGIATGMTSGVVCLDVDGYHGGDETLAAHEAIHGPLPETWESITGRQGRHIFFRHPGGYVPSKNDALGRGLDVKADGGFVVAPSSLHENGRRYVWNVDCHPDHVNLADCPAWIIEALAKHTPSGESSDKRKAVSPEQWRERAEGEIFPGSRTQRITEFAGLLLRKYIEPEVVLALVLGFNLRSCKPPLPEEKVIKDVAGIMDHEAKRREKKNAA